MFNNHLIGETSKLINLVEPLIETRPDLLKKCFSYTVILGFPFNASMNSDDMAKNLEHTIENSMTIS